jgi:DNA-binding XRE family transcriptional regulator
MAIGLQRIEIAGLRFVLIPEMEYERLCAKASDSIPVEEENLPSFPKPDKKGNFPAIEYARISLARDIIRDRRAAGLTQEELAKLAKTRQETISRIESGNYSPSIKLIDRIDAALQKAKAKRSNRKQRRS